MYVEDVKDVKRTYTYIFYRVCGMSKMLESPKSQFSKTFFQIENLLNIKEVMGKNMFVCILSL